MFGFGKKIKEENPISIISKKELSFYTEEYPIRYIFLTDLQNYKIDGVNVYLGAKDVHCVTSPTWAHYGEKLRITLYFLLETNNNGLSFQYASFTYIDGDWVFSDELKRLKFGDGESKIIYKFIENEILYSDGNKKVVWEKKVEEIILNRCNAPFQPGNVKAPVSV